MNEQALRFFMSQGARYARTQSNEPVVAGKRIRAGEICRSCKTPLPLPHSPVPKRCEFCADKHHVFMYFRRRSEWQCSFTSESHEKLPKRLAFKSTNKVREIATRGNGLINKWDRDGFELDLELGRGGIWLRLTNQQFLALGGVL